jgi:hypothetical protein
MVNGMVTLAPSTGPTGAGAAVGGAASATPPSPANASSITSTETSREELRGAQ